MTPPRHISLDFWNTLAEPNPLFARARNEYLAKLLGFTPEWVATEYRGIKRELDGEAEREGRSTPVGQCWWRLLRRLDKSTIYTAQIVEETERLFKLYPPTIPYNTRVLINDLFDQGVTFSIGSNTNFIAGHNLWRLVQLHRLPIEFGVFSDDVGYSKPHPTFFGEIKARTEGREVSHIGDSYAHDITGSHLANIQGILIESALDLPGVLAKFES